MPERAELLAAIQELERRWTEYFYVHEKDGPDILYHYTSAKGFEGIVSTRTLWASSAGFMTDTSEIKYGLQLVAKTLADQQDRIPIYKAFTRGELPGFGESFNIFITCFCQEANVPSQWDDYASKGTGLSIGIRRHEMMALAGEPQSYVLFPVIYDVARQHEIVMTIIAEAFEKIRELSLKEREWSYWWQEVGIQLLTFILRFKDPMFHNEREWRTLKLQSPSDKDALPVRYRQGIRGIIPYIELPLTANAVAEVIEGPKSSIGQKAIKIVLDKYGLNGAEVKRSNHTRGDL